MRAAAEAVREQEDELERRREALRALVVEAYELRITIKAISEITGLSRTTIYSHLEKAGVESWKLPT
jgi:DNA-directed RNA polymerase specialized sigma24 family protein